MASKYLEDTRRCSACKHPDCYCSTYWGTNFDKSPRKVLFIGLDGGRADDVHGGWKEWQERVVEHYRNERNSWNWHYRACVYMTADLLGLPCKGGCEKGCAQYPLPLCALSHFAQGNAVRCVSPDNSRMDFTPSQKKLLPSCIPLIFEEVAAVQPDIVVLQSPQVEDRFYDLLREHGELSDLTEYSAVMTWSLAAKPTVVITMYNPASFRFHASSFKDFTKTHIEPRLRTVHQWFTEHVDVSSLLEFGWRSDDNLMYRHTISPVRIELHRPDSAHFTVLTPTQTEEWPVHMLPLAASVFAVYKT